MQITDIKPYKNNAKEHPKWHIEKIANSIKAFGCNQPIVIDSEGTLVAGHGRFEAMTNLLGYTVMKEQPRSAKGEPVIPYTIADDLTDDEIKAYRLADNKINELTSHDNFKVASELQDLKVSGFDFELTGFSQDDLNMFEAVGLGEQGELDEMHQVEISQIIKLIEKRAKQEGCSKMDIVNDLQLSMAE